jgi:hypothetical protein
MTHITDSQLRARLVERLSHRARRLADVTAITHPGSTIDAIIALMAAHVAHTAMVLLGEDFAKELWTRAFDDLSESFGVCRFCRARPLRPDGTMCQFCWDEATSDDELTDEEVIAMGLDDGGVDQDEPAKQG